VLARNGIYPQVFHALLEQGVALEPGPYEAIFPSLAHTNADIDATVEACAIAAAKVVSER
jgi:glutamate-1-semialdehyde 2,1-aminomutase